MNATEVLPPHVRKHNTRRPSPPSGGTLCPPAAPLTTWSCPAPRCSSHIRCRRRCSRSGSHSTAVRPGAADPETHTRLTRHPPGVRGAVGGSASPPQSGEGETGAAAGARGRGGRDRTFPSSMARRRKRRSQLEIGDGFMADREPRDALSSSPRGGRGGRCVRCTGTSPPYPSRPGQAAAGRGTWQP